MKLSTIARFTHAINQNQPRFKLESYMPDAEMTFLAIDLGKVLSHNYNHQRLLKAQAITNMFGWCN